MIADSLIAAGLNRLFAQTPGARELLAPHAGRILALDLALLRVTLQLDTGGNLHAAPGTAAEAVVFLSPDALARLPLQGKAALQNLRGEGDAELRAAFLDALQQLDLDAEAELSRMFGPVLGFRLAESGRAFSGWLKQASEDTARAFAEYAVEEAPLLASRTEVDRFKREVEQLREDAAGLEARFAQLEKAA